MNENATPKHAFSYFTEEMDGETLLYRLGAHKAIYLNETAALIWKLIWKLCDGTRSVREIIEVLSEAFPDAQKEVVADTHEALSMLVSEGALIVASNSP
jgi:Coenzyme PQQ synthesis protein D (PqqD)